MATAQVDQTWDAEGNLRHVRTVVTTDVLDDPDTRAAAASHALIIARKIQTGEAE